jgi:hypothetical protein
MAREHTAARGSGISRTAQRHLSAYRKFRIRVAPIRASPTISRSSRQVHKADRRDASKRYGHLPSCTGAGSSNEPFHTGDLDRDSIASVDPELHVRAPYTVHNEQHTGIVNVAPCGEAREQCSRRIAHAKVLVSDDPTAVRMVLAMRFRRCSGPNMRALRTPTHSFREGVRGSPRRCFSLSGKGTKRSAIWTDVRRGLTRLFAYPRTNRSKSSLSRGPPVLR